MILLIDHYDSFTYNLYQLLGELEEEIHIVRYDKYSLDEIKKWNPKAIVLSPGPGKPEDIQQTIKLITTYHKIYPILGICLGHQAIGYAFGATITKASQIKHGKSSTISHNGDPFFSFIAKQIKVMRYHSLVIQKESLPPEIIELSFSMDDEEIMAIKHKDYPVFGLQFHPESIGTSDGKQILVNFLNQIKEDFTDERISSAIGES
jgi:anthranilate synthase component II